MSTDADIGAIEATVRDYIEGWYTGDTTRMDRALHDELVKRIPGEEAGSLRAVTKERMMEATASGGGDSPGADYEIDVFDLGGGIASVRSVSPDYVDYLHLVKTHDGWRIANVLFITRE